MRIVHNHGEVSIMNYALEASGRAGAFLQRLRDHVEAVTEREATRHCSECVVDMGWPNQRRVKVALTGRRVEAKAHSC